MARSLSDGECEARGMRWSGVLASRSPEGMGRAGGGMGSETRKLGRER
jgi:hypothetical protein